MNRAGCISLLLAVFLAACDAEGEGGNYSPPHQAILTPAQPVPSGTAPLGTMEYLSSLSPPGPVPTAVVLRTGREKYQVFCTPCHGPSGYGDGAVTQRGFPRPPSFHERRLSQIEPARIVAVISEGKGQMLPLAERIPPDQRWAIAHYVKALQLSQIPPRMREHWSGAANP